MVGRTVRAAETRDKKAIDRVKSGNEGGKGRESREEVGRPTRA
jgi:hypothetical protein